MAVLLGLVMWSYICRRHWILESGGTTEKIENSMDNLRNRGLYKSFGSTLKLSIVG